MENQEMLEVDGYLFTQKEAQLALQEKKRAEYLENHLDFNNPKQILNVYRRAIEEKIFTTPVGTEYLKRLQQYLNTKQVEGEIPPITVYAGLEPKQQESFEVSSNKAKKQNAKKRSVRNALLLSILLNLILAAMVIGMFVITIKSDNPNILNYERVLTDKYSAWEEELTQRERTVREKEHELFLQEQ